MVAMNVTPEHLQEKYGNRITFHGGLNTQTFMPVATPDEVAAEVRASLQNSWSEWRIHLGWVTFLSG